MIDFDNATFVKLSPWELESARKDLQQILHPDEEIHLAFKGIRDSVTSRASASSRSTSRA